MNILSGTNYGRKVDILTTTKGILYTYILEMRKKKEEKEENRNR